MADFSPGFPEATADELVRYVDAAGPESPIDAAEEFVRQSRQVHPLTGPAAVVGAAGHILDKAGIYKPPNSRYANAVFDDAKLRAMQLQKPTKTRAFDAVSDATWEALGANGTYGPELFRSLYCETTELGGDEDPIAGWMETHDAANLATLYESLAVLRTAGCAPRVWYLNTVPTRPRVAAQLLTALQGNSEYIRPLVERDMPLVVTPDDHIRIDATFDRLEQKFAAKQVKSPDELLFEVRQRVLESERARAHDVDGAIGQLTSLKDAAVQVTADFPEGISDELRTYLEASLLTANATLEGVRRVATSTAVIEALDEQDLDGPMKMIAGVVGLGVALTLARNSFHAPDWSTDSVAGDFDDLLYWWAFRKSAAQKGIDLAGSRRNNAEQAVLAGVALGGVTYFDTLLDPLVASGKPLNEVAAGVIFAATALGIALVGNVQIGHQRGKAYEKAAKENKVPGHLALPDDVRKAVRDETNIDAAKATILRSFAGQVALANVAWKLDTVGNIAQLEELMAPPRHNTTHAVLGKPFQRLALASQLGAGILDIIAAPHFIHQPGVLAAFGSAEGPGMLLLYALYQKHADERREAEWDNSGQIVVRHQYAQAA